MWVFATAVFLVLFFLFYKHPLIMLKASGIIMRFHLGSSFFWEEKLARACPRKCPMSAFRAKPTMQGKSVGVLCLQMTLSGHPLRLIMAGSSVVAEQAV
jgi:hypothetical protein